MIEKNRNILKNALNDLPGRKAGKSNWEHISSELDQAGIGQFLSENITKLPQYKAPASAWTAIDKALPFSFSSSLSNAFVKAGAGILVLAAIVISLILFIPENENKVMESSKSGFQDFQIRDQNAFAKEKQMVQEKNENAQKENADDPENNNASSENSYNALSVTGKASQAIENETFVSKQAKVHSDQHLNQSVLKRRALNASWMKSKGTERMFASRKKQNISLKKLSNAFTYTSDYYQKNDHIDLSLGAFYTLISFQKVSVQNMEIPESVSSFGLDLMLENRKFFLKTGLAYLSWEEKAKYTFAFRQNELVYSYNYVDSAYIQPGSGDIHYYTSSKEIYDSVSHEKADEIYYQYSVLQIPLELGYKIIDNQHLMLGLNAGVGADLKIGGREIGPAFKPKNADIISEANYLDYRFNVNWRFTGGVSLYYRISDKFRFYLEPSYHHYLRSVYKNAGLKEVSYLQLKTGIIYKF